MNFTPLPAFIGGIMIGLAVTIFMALNGRIAGISGIVGGVFGGRHNGLDWRLAFIAGLFFVPLVLVNIGGVEAPVRFPVSGIPLAIAGLLIGIGSQIGSGCVSGHGVCGNARISGRSIAATIIFMTVAIMTVFIARYFNLY